MDFTKRILLPLLLFIFSASAAQKSPLKFGEMDIENLKMTTNPIDSSAGALVIMDYGMASFDHNFQIVMEYHTRIKFFNSSEFDRANIQIPYAAGDRVERLKAVTYNLEDGEIVETKLSRKDIFEEEVNESFNRKRFTMPNVKEGSIIEYTYQVNYGSWVSLQPWYFQTSIPVLHSEYIVALPEYFHYKKITSGYITLSDYDVTSKIGHYGTSTFNLDVHRFVAKNVPAFKDEPYMTSRIDFISKIQFELNNINIPGIVNKQILPMSYAALSREYAERESFGKQLTKNGFLQNEIERITTGLTKPEDKISAIYYYVRDSFEVDYEAFVDTPRRAYKLQKGSPQDINMLLIAMYNEAGFKANAVRLSTRGNGKLHPAFALDSKFNFTICLVSDGTNEYLLDASKKNLPFNVLDESCLNGKGMVVSADDFRWVELKPSVARKSKIFAKVALSERGNIEGSLHFLRQGYEAIEFRDENKDDLDEYKKTFLESHATWTINNHEIEGFHKTEGPLKEQIDLEMENYAQSMGDMIYFAPIFYGRTANNPLKTKNRMFPVNFGSPVEETISFSIKIPEGYAAEEIPEQLAIRLPGNGGSFLYSAQIVGGYIQLISRINIDKIEFGAEEYQYLREFYAQIVEKQAEQIVLKKII